MAPLEIGLKGSPAAVGTSEKHITFFLLPAGMSTGHQGSMYPGAPALLGAGWGGSELRKPPEKHPTVHSDP